MCYMDTDSFILYIKLGDIYKNIVKDVENRFHTSNYELDYQKEKIKVIGLMKDKLGEQILTKFVWLRAKTYSYLMDDGRGDKKAKDTKKYIIKRKLKFEKYKNCL